MSGQQMLLGHNCDKAKPLILVPKLEYMTISSLGEMKQESMPSLKETPMMQCQNKYTYLHIQTLEPHMHPLISLL